jgi:ABC-2 type transport system permease protein
MSPLISAEMLKLRTTRTGLSLIGAVVGIVVLISLLATLAGDPPKSAHDARDLLGIASFAQPFALVLGLLAVTTEFRHGTITPTLIVAPDSVRLVLAKLVAHVVAGLLLGILASGLCTLIVQLIASGRGGATLPGSDVATIVVGQALATALWAALGVGLGALVRNQVGAIVGALGWTFLGENLLGIVPAGIGKAIQKYGTGGASTALAGGTGGPDGHLLGQVPGGLLMLGYAAVFVVLGIVAMRRRDITQ